MLPNGVNIRHPEKLFIGGQWVAAASGKLIDIVSPDSEEVVARVAEAGNEDMDRAVEAARKAFYEGPWSRTTPSERGRMLKALAERVRARSGELAKAWIAEVGGLPGMADGIVANGNNTLDSIARLGDEFEWITQRPGKVVNTAMIVREPVGVVAAITPWNAPHMLMSGKVGYALISGSTVIMKPAPETPLEAYILAEAAEDVGFPAGVINLVTGQKDASDHLVNNPDVDKVSFTGSTVAGKRIAEVCGRRIARYSLELGGKSAAIIRDDFSATDAANILGPTINLLSGQICAMLTRVIAPRKRHDEIADAIATYMKGVKIGHNYDEGVELGPLAMKRQLDRVESYIEDGKKTADLITGGQRPAQLNKGYFMEPTLFANVDNQSRIAQEEIFGPVLCLIPAEDEEDAIRIANESNYGLHGSVLTHDADAAYRMARRIRTGTIAQNGMLTEPDTPFGGFKQSGVGREGGVDGLWPYLETKTILLNQAPAQL